MALSTRQKTALTDGAKSAPARRSFAARILPFVAWQLVALLCVELVLYCAGIGEEEIFQFDPELGTRHMANKRVTWRSEGYSRSFLNEDGMREAHLTIAKPAGTYRIGLLGDSMVEAFQVQLEDTFGQMLQKRLNEDGDRQVQVLNFGTSGYSIVQQYVQLKKQVLKYRPDLVISCYTRRDVFENWAPPDEIVRNVRPVALQLPNTELVVENYYVRRWMKTPRARFLQAIEWLRKHSRLWGVVAAVDFDLSLHNPTYRAIARFWTHPKQEIEKMRDSLATFKPADALSTLCLADGRLSTGRKGAGRAPRASSAATEAEERFNKIIAHTMKTLLREMRDECSKAGCKFVVEATPAREVLVPTPGAAMTFSGIDYAGERKMLSEICSELHIPLIDCEGSAELLAARQKPALFYGHHLAPPGHRFVADTIYASLTKEIGMSDSYATARAKPSLQSRSDRIMPPDLFDDVRAVQKNIHKRCRGAGICNGGSTRRLAFLISAASPRA